LGGEGKTLIVSSHILTELEDYCTHVALLNKGRLASFGEIATLRSAAGSSRRISIEIIGGGERAETLLSNRANIADFKRVKNEFTFLLSGEESNQADLLAELVSAGVRITQFAEESGRIQEAYLTHMKGTRE
jgi:ABC-2 type transport system ATP-binding protein